eukprot:COSAG01_NODE_939_length_12606_cov_97.306308_3_plen_103_part_00
MAHGRLQVREDPLHVALLLRGVFGQAGSDALTHDAATPPSAASWIRVRVKTMGFIIIRIGCAFPTILLFCDPIIFTRTRSNQLATNNTSRRCDLSSAWREHA